MNYFIDCDDTLVDYSLVEKQGDYKGIPPLEGAVDFVRRHQLKKDNIYIISWFNAEAPDKVKSKYQWFFDNFPSIPYENLLIIPAPQSKAKKAEEVLGLNKLTANDILIDDAKENVHDWQSEGGRAILFDMSKISWTNL